MSESQKISITINGKKCRCEKGECVLEIANRNKIDIPHFCYHEDLPINANCRACLVEYDGRIITSCTLKAQKGMTVSSETAEVRKLQKRNIALLLAGHKKHCPKCRHGHVCKTGELMKKYGITGKEYQRPKIKQPIHKMGTAAEFDPNQCIDCNKCVQVCEKIGIGFLRLQGKAAKMGLGYTDDKCIDCIYCGQCTVSCPVAAVREQDQIEEVEKALKDKGKIVIVQMAPSIRCSIGEEFGLKPGVNLMGQCYTAFRLLGFDKIFDVNMGADITTMVEAHELVERIEKGGPMPMFTSCCPGWIKFAEFYHPEIIPHLTTARSPQIHSGGCYKTYWAKKEGIDPKKIVVVSVMPCTSKKYEAKMDKFNINGLRPVDHVISTREFASMLKERKIDLPKIKKGKVDKYGTFSGAAAIYGATGGVMESALRTVQHMLTGKDLPKIEFKEVRGMKGIKKAEVEINGTKLRVAAVTTPANVKIILEELKKDPKAYHYIEVMSCPGGCIGGGGQPIPSTERIIKERIKGLYNIDDKMKLRRAHNNLIVKEIFEEYLDKLPKKDRNSILYTSYSRKKRFE